MSQTNVYFLNNYLPPYVFFHTTWGPLGSFLCILKWGPPDHFLRLLYGAPQITFFSYNMLDRFVTIWNPHSDQFHCLLYGFLPQMSFFACYREATSHLGFFFTKYMGAPSDQFLSLLHGVP